MEIASAIGHQPYKTRGNKGRVKPTRNMIAYMHITNFHLEMNEALAQSHCPRIVSAETTGTIMGLNA